MIVDHLCLITEKIIFYDFLLLIKFYNRNIIAVFRNVDNLKMLIILTIEHTEHTEHKLNTN